MMNGFDSQEGKSTGLEEDRAQGSEVVSTQSPLHF